MQLKVGFARALLLLVGVAACASSPSAQGAPLRPQISIQRNTPRELAVVAKRGQASVTLELERLERSADDARTGRIRQEAVDQRLPYVYMIMDRRQQPISSGGMSALHPRTWTARMEKQVRRTREELRDDLRVARDAILLLRSTPAVQRNYGDELVELERTASDLLTAEAPKCASTVPPRCDGP